MVTSSVNTFNHIPVTARGHFLLHFYAAVYCLIHHVRRLTLAEGQDRENILETYPFLTGYVEEMHRFMPDDMTWDNAFEWWKTEITAWEQNPEQHLPILGLTTHSQFPFHSRLLLMIVGLVEEDSRFGTVFAELQKPLASRRPSLELAGQIITGHGRMKETDPWYICRPLITVGLLAVPNKELPRTEWALHVPSLLWDIIKGETESQPAPWCQYHAPDIFPSPDKLIFPEEFLRQLKQLPSLFTTNQARTIILRGMQGNEQTRIMGAIAKMLGLGVITVTSTERMTDEEKKQVGLLCSLTNSLPVFTYDLAPGATAQLPALTGYRGPIGIILGTEGGLDTHALEQSLTLPIPTLTAPYRLRCWQETLTDQSVDDLTEMSERFLTPGGHIRQAATIAKSYAALDQTERVTIQHVRAAYRTLNRQILDTLATHLDTQGSWNDLVVSDSAFAKLRMLEQRCCHRETLLEYLGSGFGLNGNRGVRALFTGASGTGKTLAARILASELDMDIYRVDLAAIVNKYVGETEKNLHRILARAEELDVILLLDEGDALMGTRTAVKSANDRYANLETNYLLQRLENYQGIVIITTNTIENIDSAFQRRMDVVVKFLSPQAQERWHIWQLHLPDEHAVPPATLEDIAVQCRLTGGQIRNAALHATLLAMNDKRKTVARWHIEEAIQSEYRKAGAMSPLYEDSRSQQVHGGVEAFFKALSSDHL